MLSLSSIALSLLVLFLLLLGHLLDIGGLQALEVHVLIKTLVPHNHSVEFFPRYQNIIEFLKGLMFLVHQAEDPETIALDLLNKVAV